MRVLFSFDYYLKKGIVRKKRPDTLRAKDLIEEAERKYKSMNLILDKIGLDNENANDIIEYCYNILINLIRAKMYTEGFSSSGRGAHEAEIAYLRKIGFSDIDLKIANQLRYFRNGILYYGKKFDKNYAEKILKFLNKTKKEIKK